MERLWNLMYCPATGNIEALHLEDVRNLHNVMLDKHKCHDLTGNLSTITREWSHDMLFESIRIERPLYKHTYLFHVFPVFLVFSQHAHCMFQSWRQSTSRFDFWSLFLFIHSCFCIYNLKKTVSANIMHKAHICVSDVVLWLWLQALTRHFGATSRTPF